MQADAGDLLVPFCEAASISITKDLGAILKKRFIVSLCFANTHALHDALFPEQHLDWNGVSRYLLSSACSVQDWLSLLSLLDFVNEQPKRQMVSELIDSTLAGIKVSTQGKTLSPLESLQLCFAKAGLAPSWDILCKTLLLANLGEIDHAVAIQTFLLQDNKAVDLLIKALPSCKHTPEEYSQIFMSLFQHCCQVRTHVLHDAFQARQLKKEKLKKNSQAIYHAHKKPSLTLILDQQQQQQQAGESSSDGFTQFCNTSRLASNASMLVKRAVYYLFVVGASDGYKRLIGNDALVVDAIARMPPLVVAPDMQALRAFIGDAHHTGPPCDALRHFKNSCIPGTVHWTTVLRLYLAAYPKPIIAKDLWRFAVTEAGGGLCASTETELATQRFVAQTPFDADAIADLVLAASSHEA